ncbi:MAG: SufD family Fe-S cluster assembly protein, partial [Patescibacteria group bacterium]
MLIVSKGEEKILRLTGETEEENIQIQEQGSARVFIEGPQSRTLDIVLTGADASLEVIGRFRGIGEERQEIILHIVQQTPRTSARVDFRAALSGASFSSFDGLIRVEQGAAEARGFLAYKALLLSPSAKAKPIPRLEVLTKDVASLGHAASV